MAKHLKCPFGMANKPIVHWEAVTKADLSKGTDDVT